MGRPSLTPPIQRWADDQGSWVVVEYRVRRGRRQVRVRASLRSGSGPADTTEAHYPDTQEGQAEAVTAAEELWRAHLTDQIDRPEDLEGLVESWATTPQRNGRDKAPRTIAATRVAWRHWLAAGLPSDPRRWNQSHGTAFASYLRKRKYKPQTIILITTRISVVARHGVELGVASCDPTTEARKVAPQPPRRAGIRSWIPEERWPELLAAMPTKWVPLTICALRTGLRYGELEAMRWSWVVLNDDGKAEIRIPALDPVTGWQPKGRRGRVVPLDTAAREALPVRGHDRDHVYHVTTTWHHYLALAGDDLEMSGVSPHALRRSAGARWVRKGVPIYHVSRLLGHSSVEITQKAYVDLLPSDLHDVLSAIE